MTLEVNKINLAGNVSNVSGVNTTKKVPHNTNLLNQDAPVDTVNFTGKKEMSDTEKKELILKARTKASGYAFFGSLFSTAYYGLRSDDTVAKKYNLDPVEDKKLIKNIKKQQVLWTLPACVPGLGLLPGAVAYIYNKNCDADDIELTK